MTQAYSDPKRINDPWALPDIEVFYSGTRPGNMDSDDTDAGWYWWTCFPGCLPEGDAVGPFKTEAEALEDAQVILGE